MWKGSPVSVCFVLLWSVSVHFGVLVALGGARKMRGRDYATIRAKAFALSTLTLRNCFTLRSALSPVTIRRAFPEIAAAINLSSLWSVQTFVGKAEARTKSACMRRRSKSLLTSTPLFSLSLLVVARYSSTISELTTGVKRRESQASIALRGGPPVQNIPETRIFVSTTTLISAF